MFKPMLASPADFERVRYPVLASVKMDGIRCVLHDELGPVSRNLKPIRNGYIWKELSEFGRISLDGELLTYTDGRVDPYDVVSSKVMRASGKPDFRFHVFDDFRFPGRPFIERIQGFGILDNCYPIQIVEQRLCPDYESVMMYRDEALEQGWEGIMLRDPQGPYKHGRSTAIEGWLLKVKIREDSEAIVTGFEEQFHNANEATTDALGRTERSSHQANLFGKDTLGALLCEWIDTGVDFKIGTGFDDEKRAEIWANQSLWLGRKVKFQYQGVGANGRPRFPSYLGPVDDI